MALEQLDVVHRFVARYPEAFALATTADEVERAFAAGRIASLIGLEGGSMIASSLAALRQFHARGVRYMTLTHWRTTRWADAATDAPRHDGLTRFGRRGRARDEPPRDARGPEPRVAGHDGRRARRHRGARSSSPTPGARAITDHPRNVPDEILRRVPANGGVVMAVFLSGVHLERGRRARRARPGRRGRLRAPSTRRRARPSCSTRQRRLARRAPRAADDRRPGRRPHRPPAGGHGRRPRRDRQRLRRRRAAPRGPAGRRAASRPSSASCCGAATRTTTCARSPAATSCGSCAGPRPSPPASGASASHPRRRSRSSTAPTESRAGEAARPIPPSTCRCVTGLLP